jgi:hypothetical protein
VGGKPTRPVASSTVTQGYGCELLAADASISAL